MTFPWVYLAQLLCPERHCVIAMGAECATAQEAEEMPAKVRARYDDLVANSGLDPFCGICRSRELHVEVGRSHWQTRKQAEPFLRAAEAAQLASAEILKARRN